MSKFLKFSNRIVNVASIKYININKEANRYELILNTNSHFGYSIFGTGLFKSNQDAVWASKDEHPESYEIIDKWINSVECESNKKN